MASRAMTCCGRNLIWLGLLVVAGGVCAGVALAAAGRPEPVAPPVDLTAQPEARAQPTDCASGQGSAKSAGAAATACTSVHDEARFRSTARKTEDRVEVEMQPDKQRLLIVVRSPSGIGSAVIERSGGHWPAEVVVRLHLRGLESFRAETQRAAFSLSVLSHGNHERLMKLSVDDQAEEIKPAGPTAVEVRACDAQGKPVEGLPPAGGWFEVRLPPIMLRGNPAELRLGWIDFYRG